MKIKIKILSPLHIGSGEEITPSEYLIDNGFHRINIDSLIKDSDFKPHFDKFIELAKTQRYIGDIVNHSLLKRHILYTIPISGDARSYLAKNRTIVKEFIKTAGRVYVPGSSVKGSILSAIFWFTLKEIYNNDTNLKIEDRGNQISLTGKSFVVQILQGKFRYDKIQDIVFSAFTAGSFNKNRFAHWLDITDSDTKKPEDVLQISLAKVTGAKTGGQLPILYETLKPGSEFICEIKSVKTKYNEAKLLEITNQFYKKIFEKDKIQINYAGNLIRLGQGSTAYATSFLLLAEELGVKEYRVKPPRTRKKIDEREPMGWAELIKI